MTAWARRWSEFPLVFGRMIMPMSVGCAWWALYNGWAVLSGQLIGRLLAGPVGEVIGVVSLVTGVLLCAGWWARYMAWMRAGIILTACLLGSTSAVLVAEGVGIISAGYNVPWMAMAGLAWLIEVRDTRAARP